MKQIYNTRELAIPDDVTCDIKSKVVTVKGPRGESSQRIGALPERERERSAKAVVRESPVAQHLPRRALLVFSLACFESRPPNTRKPCS